MDIVKNDDGSFMSEAQIVNYMISTLKDEKSKAILASNFRVDPFETPDTLAMSEATGIHPKALYRSMFGRQIRNTFGLWDKTNPHTLIDPKPNKEGIIDHPLHPDNLSDRVVTELVKYYSTQIK